MLEYVELTADGGSVASGHTLSNDGDVTGNHGLKDYWVAKCDAEGNLQWQKCLGGSGPESAGCVVQTADGGYVCSGSTRSTDGDVTGNHGYDDVWVMGLDAGGTWCGKNVTAEPVSTGERQSGSPPTGWSQPAQPIPKTARNGQPRRK